MRPLLLIAAVLVALSGCGHGKAQEGTREFRVRVVNVYPHDRAAFTQGLEFRDGNLYETTGIEGRSSLRRVELDTGRVIDLVPLTEPMFGEGMTLFNKEIFQLTWQSQTGFVYRQEDLQLVRRFSYPGEGWGLTNDGERIYMSDGSDEIRVWDPETLQEQRRIQVRDDGRPVRRLNELEFVRGEILANVWQTERIARISPTDGRVLGWIDASNLLTPEDLSQPIDVLNGIAYDEANDRLFITGKLWPKLFEVQLVEREQ